MRLIDADALTEFLKCLLPARGMWEIEGDTVKNAVCETVAEAIEMVKNMETIHPEKSQLSQEGKTKGTTSDLINRQDAIDAVEKNACNTQRIMDAVNNLPPAQPEPHEGHWKKDETDDCPPVFRQFRICSVCGAIETSETNYCPKCGAKMINK